MTEGAPASAASHPSLGLALYIAGVAVAAVALTAWVAVAVTPPDIAANWGALVVLVGLLVVAEYLFVRFRYGGEVSTLNLVEAVLAPMLLVFPGLVVVASVAAAQAVGSTLRRNQPVKTLFNVAQWSLAAAAGAAVVGIDSEARVDAPSRAAALIVALAVVGLANHTAFAGVLAVVNRRSIVAVLRELAPVLVVGWFVGWGVNTLVGLLFAFAYLTDPVSVLLFPVPVIVLHLAYRGYAGARSDRLRLTGLHRAARALAAPLDPRDAVEVFLEEVTASFEARAAALVLHSEREHRVHLFDTQTTPRYAVMSPAPDADTLETRLADATKAVRVLSTGHTASRALTAAGWRDCLCAPLQADDRTIGLLLVYDQTGLEGFEAGELAVLEALAREVVGTFAKGQLLSAILDERQKLAEIVGTTSDGILTIAADGTVRSWNPAVERITGVPSSEAVGRPALAELRPRTLDDTPVHLERWAEGIELPGDLRITSRHGQVRRLACSFSRAGEGGEHGDLTLVVVARDATPVEQMEELRERFGQLAAAEAAQRSVVEQLQQAVIPPQPSVPGVELAVSFLASEESSPTGGDLYDWHVLPSGELHLAVVDVLGHGVSATKDALSVISTLRLLALQGCPLDELVARTDDLLAAGQRELVATVVVARFDPTSGVVRVAGGGHPPPLVVSADGEVRQIVAPGCAVGWPGAGSELAAEFRLAPSDTLVLYTDGLIEARKDILEGMDVLVQEASLAAHLPAQAMADRLLDRALAGAERRDDSLALVVRATTAELRHEETWRFPPDKAQVPIVRRQVVTWLAARELRGDDLQELALVTSELLANAVAAGRSMVELRVTLDPSRVRFDVENDGEGPEIDIDKAGRSLPPPDAQAGRGLFLVRSLTDNLTASTAPGRGTVVSCTRRLGAGPALSTGNGNGDGVDATRQPVTG
ncbi:MAG: SpoIIE family protein phosphatase [Actinobacteria bacterium]|nr:SpoIIE family protein phosphatase [Actinomycetota bacterium]